MGTYVSLDPAHADSMTRQARQRLWWQRVQEQHGGQPAAVLGVQFFATGSLLAYASMKQSNGFTLLPFAAKKTPHYAGIFFAGFVGYKFALAICRTSIGDGKTLHHLHANKSAIMNGNGSWDPQK